MSALFRVKYNFMRQSGAEFNDSKNLTTFEMLLTVPVDMDFFEQILVHCWNDLIQQDHLVDMAVQVVKKKGNFVIFMFKINQEQRNAYLAKMQKFLNQQSIKDNKLFN